MNEKSIQTLELNKVLEKLADYCTFSAGVDLARELFPVDRFRGGHDLAARNR